MVIQRPRLSIVVLPFAISAAISSELLRRWRDREPTTTDLSRISGSFVVRRHTAFTHKSDAFDLKKIKRESNVPCVLEGSVQRGGKRLRVSILFVDAESGRHLSNI